MDDAFVSDRQIAHSAMRKVFWHILPLTLLAYLCAFIDRLNVSFAATQMNADLGFSATMYGLGGGLFFLGYALFEIPSNLMLVRFGARKWIARIMITWGLLSGAMAFVHTAPEFYLLRFALGVAEAGFFPGVVYYFSVWFPRCHRSRAISRFYVATPLASLVMGALSAWLLGLDGFLALRGWQLLFLIQALPSVLIGVAVLCLLPGQPSNVSWLSDAEKQWIQSSLSAEQARIGEPHKHSILACLHNPRVLSLGIFGFLIVGANITFGLSAPMIVQASTGFTIQQTGFVVSLGGLIGAAAMLSAGNFADSYGDRALMAFWFSLLFALGCVTIGLSSSSLIALAGYLAVAASLFTIPMLSVSLWAEVLHEREFAVGGAAINSISALGSFVMPFAWGAARDATGSFTIGLFGVALACVLAGGVILQLRENVLRRQSVGGALSAA